MSTYLLVAEEEGEEIFELPTENDATLLLKTLAAKFPGASGLKFRNPESNRMRVVYLLDGRLSPPDGGWGNNTYYCEFHKQNKRKSDDRLENTTTKTNRMETTLTFSDLIVIGLPCATTEQMLREYFETFGEVLIAQVKKDRISGHSKRFIRFSSHNIQMQVLGQKHTISGKSCDVKIAITKEGQLKQMPRQVFVGRCSEDITQKDLRTHFSQYGEVIDVHIPRPFRKFAFVTFRDPYIAQGLYGQSHIIKGTSVYLSNPVSRGDPSGSGYSSLNRPCCNQSPVRPGPVRLGDLQNQASAQEDGQGVNNQGPGAQPGSHAPSQLLSPLSGRGPSTGEQQTTGPVTIKQETTRPVTIKQETTGPVTIKQETTGPVTIKHETTGPVTIKQETTGPVTIKLEADSF